MFRGKEWRGCMKNVHTGKKMKRDILDADENLKCLLVAGLGFYYVFQNVHLCP